MYIIRTGGCFQIQTKIDRQHSPYLIHSHRLSNFPSRFHLSPIIFQFPSNLPISILVSPLESIRVIPIFFHLIRHLIFPNLTSISPFQSPNHPSSLFIPTFSRHFPNSFPHKIFTSPIQSPIIP